MDKFLGNHKNAVSKIFIFVLFCGLLGNVSSLGHRYDEEAEDDYTNDDLDEPDRRGDEDDEEEEDEDDESESRSRTTLNLPTSSPVPFTTSTTVLENHSTVLETIRTEDPPTTTYAPLSTERQALTYHSVVRNGNGTERRLIKEVNEGNGEERYTGRGAERANVKNYDSERHSRKDSVRYATRTTTPRSVQRPNSPIPSECASGINTVRDPGRESLKTYPESRRARISRRRDLPEVTTEVSHYRGRRPRGSVRAAMTTTTAAPVRARGVSQDWRAREIERRRGLNRVKTITVPETQEIKRVNITSLDENKKPPVSPRIPMPRGRYMEYEESEVFEDGKPVVKKKRVQKLIPESEEGDWKKKTTTDTVDVESEEDSVKESSDSSQRISSTPGYSRRGKGSHKEAEQETEDEEEEEEEAPRKSKTRKSNWKDEHEDLYRNFHDHEDDEYYHGPVGHGSERRSVRRKHYDPYQDYFDFVYSLSHPEDPYPHHHHHNPHRRSPGVEEDSTPEGSSFRKRFFKAWHSTDAVDDEIEPKRSESGRKEPDDEL